MNLLELRLSDASAYSTTVSGADIIAIPDAYYYITNVQLREVSFRDSEPKIFVYLELTSVMSGVVVGWWKVTGPSSMFLKLALGNMPGHWLGHIIKVFYRDMKVANNPSTRTVYVDSVPGVDGQAVYTSQGLEPGKNHKAVKDAFFGRVSDAYKKIGMDEPIAQDLDYIDEWAERAKSMTVEIVEESDKKNSDRSPRPFNPQGNRPAPRQSVSAPMDDKSIRMIKGCYRELYGEMAEMQYKADFGELTNEAPYQEIDDLTAKHGASILSNIVRRWEEAKNEMAAKWAGWVLPNELSQIRIEAFGEDRQPVKLADYDAMINTAKANELLAALCEVSAKLNIDESFISDCLGDEEPNVVNMSEMIEDWNNRNRQPKADDLPTSIDDVDEVPY